VQVRRDAARFGISRKRFATPWRRFLLRLQLRALLLWAWRPSKRARVGDEHGGLMQWVEFCKSSNDGMAGIGFVVGGESARGLEAW